MPRIARFYPHAETRGLVRPFPRLSESAVVIGVAARLEDAIKHFSSQHPKGERGNRYVYMESGALAQNVHLQAESLGLGCVLVAGFEGPLAKVVFMLPPDWELTALLCVGHKLNKK